MVINYGWFACSFPKIIQVYDQFNTYSIEVHSIALHATIREMTSNYLFTKIFCLVVLIPATENALVMAIFKWITQLNMLLMQFYSIKLNQCEYCIECHQFLVIQDNKTVFIGNMHNAQSFMLSKFVEKIVYSQLMMSMFLRYVSFVFLLILHSSRSSIIWFSSGPICVSQLTTIYILINFVLNLKLLT